MADPDEYLTADEIAERYKVSRQTVGRWARQGILPTAAVTPGGQRRFLRSDVEELMAPKAVAE